MTQPDFRALCAELVTAFKDESTYTQRVEILDRARTALATPQPKPPTDGEGKKTILRQAAESAFQALEGWENYGSWVWPVSALEQARRSTKESLDLLRTALATPPPEPLPTPDLSALAAIGERLRTQDNRGTADPIFQVRGLRRIYGMDPDYVTDTVWVDTGNDYIEVNPPDDPEDPGDFLVKTGYSDIWEVLAVAFTKEGCEEHLKLNGHNYRHGYKKVKIYADYIHRCPEMLAIREALMALPGESVPPPEPLRPIPVSESFQSLGQFLTELIKASETTSPAEPVTSDEISALSWNLEKAGIVLSIVDIARAALEKWGQR